MSHYRGIKTRMRNLRVVHEVLTARGYQPQCLSAANVRVDLKDAEVLKIPAEQIHPNAYSWCHIRFKANKDGNIITMTDDDVLSTGINADPKLVNRAGGGINGSFEREVSIDWAIATALETAKAQGFNVYEGGIIREGNKVKIGMWRPSPTSFSASAKTSSTVIL